MCVNKEVKTKLICLKYVLLFALSFSLFLEKTLANESETMDRLKQDLQHETDRRKAYLEFVQQQKKRDKEREQGLSYYLEEEEKWALEKAKDLINYKKTKRRDRNFDENTPEFKQDLMLKQNQTKKLEVSRQNYKKAKDAVLAQFRNKDLISEETELNIYNNRPRFEQSKRFSTKWLKKGAQAQGSGYGASSGSSSGYVPPPNMGAPQPNDFDFTPPPPTTDYNNGIPQDGFDDFPPPPQPPAFDPGNSNGTFDSGFGNAPLPPPPPPPIQDGFDF